MNNCFKTVLILFLFISKSILIRAQGTFNAKNLGGQPILQNRSPLSKATGKIEILDGVNVIASGSLIKDGYFALGNVYDPAFGSSTLITIRAWDSSIAKTFDQAKQLGRGYGSTTIRISLANGNVSPIDLVSAGFIGFDIESNPQPTTRLSRSYSTGEVIDIVRADIPNAKIQINVRTWLIIHGWKSSRTESNIVSLTAAISNSRPNDQVLTLDWSNLAKTSTPEKTAVNIVPVSEWASTALQAYGIKSNDLNIIGHSFGAYVADEIAKKFPAKVNSIVALDPAADCCTSVFDPISNDEIDFRRDSNWSWAFHASVAGNEITPVRATESFIIDTGLTAQDAHSNAVWLFARMVAEPNNLINNLFSLSNLLDYEYGPWALDQYKAYFDGVAGFFADKPIIGYEAIIYDPLGSVVPSRIEYIRNQPYLSSGIEARSIYSPIAYLSGQASDRTNGGNHVSVLINGATPQQMSSDGASGLIWKTGYYLNPGTNIFNIVATDDSPAKVSTTNTLSVVYIVDTTKPITLMAAATNILNAKNISIHMEAPYGATLKLSQSMDFNQWLVLGTVQARTPSAVNITNGTVFVNFPINPNPSLLFKAEYVQ